MNRNATRAPALTCILLSSPSLLGCQDGFYDGTGSYQAVPPRTGASASQDMGNFFRDNIEEDDNAVGPYYVLLRDCAFPACHANQERFFRVFGPGRERIPEVEFGEPVKNLEGVFARVSAQEFIDPDNPSQSMLLRKPLAVSAGGMGHGGVDNFGRDVYSSINDEGYRALARWVENGAEQPNDEEE